MAEIITRSVFFFLFEKSQHYDLDVLYEELNARVKRNVSVAKLHRQCASFGVFWRLPKAGDPITELMQHLTQSSTKMCVSYDVVVTYEPNRLLFIHEGNQNTLHHFHLICCLTLLIRLRVH